MPVSTLLQRAGIGLRYFGTLCKAGKAPAPVKGVPAPLARAWLDARGNRRPLPAGEFIRVTVLCDLAGIAPTSYYESVKKGRAPRQLKGVRKSEALDWLHTRGAGAANGN